MPNFNKWVKNVTSTMDFSHSTEWEFPIDVPSSMKAVEAIVRQITFVPDHTVQNDQCILIWCSISNSIIASVTDNAPVVIAPQTTLSMPHPFVGPIKFKAHLVNGAGIKDDYEAGAGKIAITMDIIGVF